jgi:hypothetical protein
MGGARNFSHYAAAATLSFLAKRRVKSWILLDRDERDNEEIERFRKTAGELAKVKVLDQREIENLLLVPRAILEMIKLKVAPSGSAAAKPDRLPTEEQIARSLDEAIEKLKCVAAEKRVTKALCVPVYPAKDIHDVREGESVEEKVRRELGRMQEHLGRLRDHVDEVCKAKRAEVEENWQLSRAQLVPGELVLDLVLTRLGLRFNKDHDAARLAGLMRPDEIDPAMKTFIEELGGL